LFQDKESDKQWMEECLKQLITYQLKKAQ
jgi:hypothetical protein